MSTKGLLLPILALLIGVQGCHEAVPLETLCALPDWSQFEQEVKSAQISLAPWVEEPQGPVQLAGAPTGRSPASLQILEDHPQEIDATWTDQQGLNKLRVQNQLSARDRDAWTKWSHKKLRRLQDLIDQVEYHPERRQARDEFSKVANGLVNFHGYSEQGKIGSMLEALRKIRESSVKGYALLCKP